MIKKALDLHLKRKPWYFTIMYITCDGNSLCKKNSTCNAKSVKFEPDRNYDYC